MLDRILNINPQEKYKSGLKVATNPYYSVNRHDQEKQHAKDSALFSPLAKLMSKINWKILGIEYPSHDEMLFHFLVGDLEFITVINFTEMYTQQFHEFSIYKAGTNKGKRLNYEIKLKSEKYEISVLEKADPIVTDSLSKLFERVIADNVFKEQSISQSSIIKKYVTGIEESLNEELNYILKVIYTFISTRNGSRIKNNFILKTQKNIPIMMHKVALIYSE